MTLDFLPQNPYELCVVGLNWMRFSHRFHDTDQSKAAQALWNFVRWTGKCDSASRPKNMHNYVNSKRPRAAIAYATHQISFLISLISKRENEYHFSHPSNRCRRRQRRRKNCKSFNVCLLESAHDPSLPLTMPQKPIAALAQCDRVH